MDALADVPKSTGGKTNLTASWPSGSNLFSAALTLAERRHYLAPHTGPGPTYGRMCDIPTLQNAAQLPDFGGGAGRTNGAVLFPDGDIVMVPSNSTSIVKFRATTETGYTVPCTAPGNAAFLGGALWIDDMSILMAPHNEHYAWVVHKETGAKTVLTGYDFGGNFACAGVRLCSTGEYYFVPHNHTSHVFLDPVTLTFRTLAVAAPGLEAYVDCTNLPSGELYVAAHKAACSVVIDPTTGAVLNTLPPSGTGYVAPASNYANFRTCRYLPDGDVVLCPFKHSKAWRYNRSTNQHVQLPGTYSEGAVGCSSLTEMGDVMLWPWNGSAAYKLSTGCGVLIDPHILTSPYINGF